MTKENIKTKILCHLMLNMKNEQQPPCRENISLKKEEEKKKKEKKNK